MISFQRLLGREDEFFSLLEASALEGSRAVAELRALFRPGAMRSLETFAAVRRKDKEITTRLQEMLVTTFVTPMEREDIEALADALYKIPKTVEKFAERYLIVEEQLKDVDFSRQLILVEQAVQLVHRMILALKEGRDLGGIKALQNELQLIESHADDLVLDMMQALYRPGFPALKAVMLHDLFALNEKVVDRCRDAGDVLSHVLLKNS
ncbi:MAG: DUF47 family protein [Verrucomicrobia bacterium]|nr:DUF47 family protein [Verrucomicrobiota bacterium]MBI3868855.1 DUF47 family protein [Verrucomicrobiota bacterium]